MINIDPKNSTTAEDLRSFLIELGEQLLRNAERLADGEVANPCVKFMLDVRRKDGSTTMMCVSLTHARQADAEVSFAGRPKGPSWYEEVKE